MSEDVRYFVVIPYDAGSSEYAHEDMKMYPSLTRAIRAANALVKKAHEEYEREYGEGSCSTIDEHLEVGFGPLRYAVCDSYHVAYVYDVLLVEDWYSDSPD